MQVTEEILIARIVVCYPISTIIFFTPFRALPSVALLLFSSSSIVQFSRCRRRSKTGSKHSNALTFKCFDPFFVGGDKRDRTADLLRAKQALSHLSYTPKRALVGQSGLEPPTSRLSVVCSNQLSYWPIYSGGDERNRTADPLLARQVLSQLSYTPTIRECTL